MTFVKQTICHVIQGVDTFKMADNIRIIPQQANECPEDKYLNRHVVSEVAAVWRDLGIELLGQGGIAELDVIKANNVDDVTKCCSAMLTLWRKQQTDASWSQLIEALKQLKLNRIATEIEKRLKSRTEDKVTGVTPAMKTTPTQQQDEPTKYNLQEDSSKGMFSHLQRHAYTRIEPKQGVVLFILTPCITTGPE